MPTEWQSHGSGRPYRQFSAIKIKEGEDPARFLHQEITPDSDYDPGATGMLIFARIRGIETLSLLNAWRAVERQLHDGGRDLVMEALDRREAELTDE